MNHPAAQNLYPAFAFAETTAFAAAFKAGDIHLRGGLREGEMVGAEFYFCLCAEKFAGEFGKSPFQIGKCDIFVDDQALNLMEGGGMCGVDLI